MKKNYNYIFKKIEDILLTITIVSFILLLFSQIIGSNNNYASVFSSNQTSLDTNTSNYGIIIIAIDNLKFSKIEIIKNRKVTENFKNKKELLIKVKDKDILEINGTMYQEVVKIKIVGISENINYPKLNQLIQTSKSIELIGQVNLK